VVGQDVQVADDPVEGGLQPEIGSELQVPGAAGGDHQGVEAAGAPERRDDAHAAGPAVMATGRRQPPLHGRQGQRPVDRAGAADQPRPGSDPAAQLVDLVFQIRVGFAGELGLPGPEGGHPQLGQLLGQHPVGGRADGGQPGARRPGPFQPLQDRGR
jgi:hypothetical protein